MLLLYVFPSHRRLPPVCWVEVDHDWIRLRLHDGARFRLPTAWSPGLSDASPAARDSWNLTAAGRVVHWPRVGEALTLLAIGMLRPTGPRRRPRPATARCLFLPDR